MLWSQIKQIHGSLRTLIFVIMSYSLWLLKHSHVGSGNSSIWDQYFFVGKSHSLLSTMQALPDLYNKSVTARAVFWILSRYKFILGKHQMPSWCYFHLTYEVSKKWDSSVIIMAFLCHPPEHAQVTTLIQSLSPSHSMAQVQDNPELCFCSKHNLSQFQNPAESAHIHFNRGSSALFQVCCQQNIADKTIFLWVITMKS